MAQFAVTSVPQRLADLLGIGAARLAVSPPQEIWLGTLENAGPSNVFLARSVAVPDVTAVVGSRLTRNARREIREYSGGARGGAWWLWTARATDRSTLISEPGNIAE